MIRKSSKNSNMKKNRIICHIQSLFLAWKLLYSTVTERASQTLSFSGHRKLSFTLKNKNKRNKEKKIFLKVSNVSKVSKFKKNFSRSLSPEISVLRRSLKVNLFFKSRILSAGSLFFSKSECWFFIRPFFIGPYYV